MALGVNAHAITIACASIDRSIAHRAHSLCAKTRSDITADHNTLHAGSEIGRWPLVILYSATVHVYTCSRLASACQSAGKGAKPSSPSLQKSIKSPGT